MVLEFIERDQEPLEDDVQLTASSLSYKNATGVFFPPSHSKEENQVLIFDKYFSDVTYGKVLSSAFSTSSDLWYIFPNENEDG